jgi:hypothetical protein
MDQFEVLDLGFAWSNFGKLQKPWCGRSSDPKFELSSTQICQKCYCVNHSDSHLPRVTVITAYISELSFNHAFNHTLGYLAESCWAWL